MSTCYCIKNVAKHYTVRESMCVCASGESERGRKRGRETKESRKRKKKGRGEKDAAQQAEGKVNAPAEENVL